MLKNEIQYLESYIAKSSNKLLTTSGNLIRLKDNLAKSISEYVEKENDLPKKEEEKEQMASKNENHQDPIKSGFDDKDVV
jgi:hypothetical protein